MSKIYNYTMNEINDKQEVTIGELFSNAYNYAKYVLSKWLVIIVVISIGALIGLLISVYKKPIFESTLTFALEEESSGASDALGLASQFGFDLGAGSGGAFKGPNVLELFKSRLMVVQTLLSPINLNGKTQSMADAYISINKLDQNQSKKSAHPKIHFEIGDSNLSRKQDSVLNIIYSSILLEELSIIQKDKKVQMFYLEIHSKNELFAKIFTETLAFNVTKFYVESKSKKARANLAILEQQTDSVRKELNSALSGVAVATDQTFGLNPALNVRRISSAKQEVEVKMNTAILSELIKQQELARVSVRKQTPLLQIIDKPILPLKNDSYSKTKSFLIGGFLAGFIVIVFLVLRKYIKSSLISNELNN